MGETKICTQCQIEKDIDDFIRRPQKNNPGARMKACRECHNRSLAETKRREADFSKRRQEEQEREESERIAREKEREWIKVRAAELSLQANKRCPTCKQPRTDGSLWIDHAGKEHFFFSRQCQACKEGTPHQIYRLICPLTQQVRYVGIASQPLRKRLTGHMRNESGTEWKSDWIENLHAHGLVPLIEPIDRAPNERDAKIAEQTWIDHYLSLGCPLTNDDTSAIQRVLDVQSGRMRTPEEKTIDYRVSARQFRHICQRARSFQIIRWFNRVHCAYCLDTTVFQFQTVSPFSQEIAQRYEQIIFEHTLPGKRDERENILSHVTIAYVYWREQFHIWQKRRKGEDLRYFWERKIPIICTKVEGDYTSQTGFVTGLSQENVPLIHPFCYSVDPARALTGAIERRELPQACI